MSKIPPITTTTSHLPPVITQNFLPIAVALVAIVAVTYCLKCRMQRPMQERQIQPGPQAAANKFAEGNKTYQSVTSNAAAAGTFKPLLADHGDLTFDKHLAETDPIYKHTLDRIIAIHQKDEDDVLKMRDLLDVANSIFLQYPDKTMPFYSLLQVIFLGDLNVLRPNDIGSLILAAFDESRDGCGKKQEVDNQCTPVLSSVTWNAYKRGNAVYKKGILESRYPLGVSPEKKVFWIHLKSLGNERVERLQRVMLGLYQELKAPV